MKPELLSPAGNLEKLKYAFAFGADAVYAGVPKYSLRTRENDFRNESLAEGMAYARAIGKKVYLTLNIYAHNTKINGFLKEMDRLSEYKPDALIMADPGLIAQTIKRYPDIPIHLSTQANATNWTAVSFWRDIGVKRIILSRELRLKEIAEIHEKVPDIELESFVHGAICIAYSGRCLISNYMNNRDANQGTCTNSCRWEYTMGQDNSLVNFEKEQHAKRHTNPIEVPEGLYVTEPKRPDQKFPIDEDEHGTYLFNAKDLCAIELLNDLKNAGIVSFKIEGRTKSAYYAAMTARAYRKAIDDIEMKKPFDEENLRNLVALSNRGFTTGFYMHNPRELGENVQDSRSSERTHKPVGTDCRFDEEAKLLWFEVKNKLDKGTEVEIITRDSIKKMEATDLRNDKERHVPSLHGGTGRGAIHCDENPGEFAIIRRKLYPEELELIQV
jgi:U32 family peptidase